jgi:CubicO group peptidase (beta-lactamase class C family)
MSEGRPEGMTADSWQEWPHNRWAYQHIDEVLRTVRIPHGGTVLELMDGAPLEVEGLDSELEALSTDGLIVLRGREVVLERYFNGMTPATPHLLQSVTKSVCSAVLSPFVAGGLIDVRTPIGAYVPELRGSAYEDALVQHALDMTVAVAYDETYDDTDSDVNEHDRASGWKAPRTGGSGSIPEFLATLQKNGEHGRRWHYCSANTDVLAWVLESVTGSRFTDLWAAFWPRLGAEHDALMTVDVDGFSLASGGGCVTLRDLARFGRLFLEGGVGATGDQIVPEEWVDDVRWGVSPGVDYSGLPESMQAHGSYRDQFWRPGDDHGCFFGVGIYGQYVWVNPATDVVVAKLSTLPAADDTDAFETTRVLLDRLSTLATTAS